jgi:glucose-1-phosphate adenylyltransferase
MVQCASDSFSVLLLAGGEGRRLRPLTLDLAKPAVPFGACNRVIDFTLSNCVHSGVSEVLLLTQYRSESIGAHLDRHWSNEPGGFRWRLRDPSRGARGVYLATADAVGQSLADVPPHARDVLVLGADHVYRMDYRSIVEAHRAKRSDVTIACVDVDRNAAHAFGVLDVDGRDRIRGFAEKPAAPIGLPGRPDRCLVSMGIYVLRRELLEAIARTAAVDFGRDVLPVHIARRRVFVHRFADPIAPATSYWRDIGTLDSYWQCAIDFAGSARPFDLHDPRWPIKGARLTQVVGARVSTSMVAPRVSAAAPLSSNVS